MVSKRMSYQAISDWERLPAGYLHREVTDVAVDSGDRVYLLTRHDPHVMVYDREGSFVRSWGEDILSENPHRISVGPDGSIYIVDSHMHAVRKFSGDGKLLMTIGSPGKASATGFDEKLSDFHKRLASIRPGGLPFNRPTGLALGLNGDLYISDGYRNARVHRFSAVGDLIQSWGSPGAGPGQFNLPHAIACTPAGKLMVVDWANERIQVFEPDGEYLGQWTDMQHPSSIFVDREGLVYVTELPWYPGEKSLVHGIIREAMPAGVRVLDPKGNTLLRMGGADPCAPGSFCAPHGLCVDSRGDLYVAEVTYGFAVKPGRVPADCHTFQKLARFC